MTELRRVVVVGASLAGLRAAEALRREGYIGSITMVGDEPEMPYDRPPLSKELLAGVYTEADVRLSADDGLEAEWKLGSPAVALDADAKEVVLGTGERVPYDGLVIATGSGARQLPTFDATLPHVHTVRTLADAAKLRAALTPSTRLLVVGCGFVGIETASSARSLGVEVTVVGMDAPVAPAGPLASTMATRLLAEAGVALHTGHTVREVEEVDGALRVTLSDGAVVVADHVVVAVGSVPHVGWLAGSGAEVSNGLVCDEALRVTGLEDVVAAGDIVSWPNAAFGGMRMRVEHWSNAVEQGAAAARSLLAGSAAEPFGSVPSFWSDHFGIRLQSVGVPRLATRFHVTAGDPETGAFCAEAFADDVLVGGIAYGMPRQLVGIRMKLVRGGVMLAAVEA